MYNIILGFFKDSKLDPALVVGGVVLISMFGLFYLGYVFGKDAGFIPKAELCKEEIINAGKCDTDLIACKKDFLECKVKLDAKCELDSCLGECARQVRSAINNYKQLQHKIHCGE